MATDILQQGGAIADLGRSVPAAQVPDAFAVATSAWTRALESCADSIGLQGSQAAADQVRDGNALARMHCCHGLAEQVAASLRASYKSVQAVYAPYCDTCPQDFCVDKGAHNTPLVHLLIWTQRKSPALNAGTAALGNALANVGQDVIGIRELPSLLEAQLIDNTDLEKLFGAGHRERWPVRLQGYLLDMDEPVEEV
jgi:hypothetical protein